MVNFSAEGSIDSSKAPEPVEVELRNGKKVRILKYSDLDERTQAVALRTIGEINLKTSTDPKTTWASYTSTICQRIHECKNAKNTLFLALDGDKVIGYVAFYTRQDNLTYANKFLKSAEEAYCSWTAVSEDYRGNGLAEYLKLQIFNPEHKISKFIGHIKATNEASLKVLSKFGKEGYPTESQQIAHQFLYSVSKKE